MALALHRRFHLNFNILPLAPPSPSLPFAPPTIPLHHSCHPSECSLLWRFVFIRFSPLELEFCDRIVVELDYDTGKLATKFVQRRRVYCHPWIKYWIPDFGIKERIDHILSALYNCLSLHVAAERVLVLNTVRSKLPVAVTTTDDAKDSVKEEIRLRMSLKTI